MLALLGKLHFFHPVIKVGEAGGNLSLLTTEQNAEDAEQFIVKTVCAYKYNLQPWEYITCYHETFGESQGVIIHKHTHTLLSLQRLSGGMHSRSPYPNPRHPNSTSDPTIN